MKSAPHPLHPHLDGLTADMTTINDDIRWAYTDAWWPTVNDPLEPTAPGIPRDIDPDEPPRDDPDHVDGGKYDLGVGDDISRHAIETVVPRLAHIEIRTAAAVFLTDLHPEQPAVRQPDMSSPLIVIAGTITGIRWRLGVLRTAGESLPPAARPAIRRQLRRARADSDTIVRELHAALSRGATSGLAHAERKCRICAIRPQAQRERQARLPNGDRRLVTKPSKGGRCDTCAQYFTRNGTERPRDIDRDIVADAIAAAARRRQRGEGWGAA